MNVILWVGADFDPTSRNRKAFDGQHEAIDNLCIAVRTKHPELRTDLNGSGATEEYDTTTIIDIFNAFGSRLGFGIRVKNTDEGKSSQAHVEEWMRAKGILLPVRVCAWRPGIDSRPRIRD